MLRTEGFVATVGTVFEALTKNMTWLYAIARRPKHISDMRM